MLSGDGMPSYESEFKNQSFSQETKNDFLPNPVTPGCYYDLQELKKSMEQFSELKHDNF